MNHDDSTLFAHHDTEIIDEILGTADGHTVPENQ